MEILDKLIQTTIANKVFDKDQYGQIHIREYQVGRLFSDKDVRDRVTAFLNSGQSKLYRLSLYGGSLGQFYAIKKL